MQELYVEVHGYLNMDEELPYDDFDKYYKKVIKYLSENIENLNEDELWKGLFVVENILSNADSRSKEKGSKAKKYKKIMERSSLWSQNIATRLYKLGYKEDEINERFEKMFEEDAQKLRERLLGIKGIGPETADSILLYAARKPVFVVDAYTYRILLRHNLIPEETTYFKIRQQGPYGLIWYSVFIINFVMPILILMSRPSKRNYFTVCFMALMIIFGHWLDFYIMTMPGPLGANWHLSWFEIGIFAGFVGLLIFTVSRTLASASLVPNNHPLLKEAILHQS